MQSLFQWYQRHYGVTVTTQTFAYKPQCIFFHLKNTPHLSCTLSSSFTHSSSVVLITISSAYCRVVPLLLSVYHSYLITLPSQHLYFNLHRREARSRNERRKGVKMQNLSWDIIYFIAYVYIVPIRSCSTSVKPVYLVRHE